MTAHSRKLFLVVCLLAAPFLGACTDSTRVDERLVGHWQELSSQWRVTVQVGESGSYATTVDGHGSPDPETGKLEARRGKWKLVRDDGRHNQGTYSFRSGDVVVLEGKRGPITWVRWGRDTGGGRKSPSPLKAGWPIEGLPSRARRADVIARAWNDDAQLIGIGTRLLPPASTAPYNVQTSEGHAVLAFHFCSPRAYRRLRVAPNSPRGMVSEERTGSCDGSRSIPEDFLDLPDAVAKARRDGMPEGQPESAEIMYNYGIRKGEPTGWVWRIHPPEGSARSVYLVPL